MPEINIFAILVAAAVPNALGALYYGPLFGKRWLSSLNMTADDMKGRNEGLIYGGAYLLCAVVCFFSKFLVELAHKDVNDQGELIFASFHTFPHGAIHGSVIAIGIVIPIIVCLGLFQKSTTSNILINSLFWLICFAIMGGILDVWN